MEMIGYLGKKVDITCTDGAKYSGYVCEVSDAEDSDIGCDSIEFSPLDSKHAIEIPIEDILDVKVDTRYREFDFRH